MSCHDMSCHFMARLSSHARVTAKKKNEKITGGKKRRQPSEAANMRPVQRSASPTIAPKWQKAESINETDVLHRPGPRKAAQKETTSVGNRWPPRNIKLAPSQVEGKRWRHHHAPK